MSKSKGNVIYADDLVELFGVDAVRYFVLHEMPFENDGVITWDLLVERMNSDLANTLEILLTVLFPCLINTLMVLLPMLVSQMDLIRILWMQDIVLLYKRLLDLRYSPYGALPQIVLTESSQATLRNC